VSHLESGSFEQCERAETCPGVFLTSSLVRLSSVSAETCPGVFLTSSLARLSSVSSVSSLSSVSTLKRARACFSPRVWFV
ncbi:MAG: hypothetical protein ACRDDA_13025, partial [Aeromonas sp.]